MARKLGRAKRKQVRAQEAWEDELRMALQRMGGEPPEEEEEKSRDRQFEEIEREDNPYDEEEF